MRYILGAIVATAIAGVAFVQPAEARCFWNGFETVCVRHGPMYGDWGYHHHFYRDFDRPIYRNWY
jgi:hypothetical protein